MHGIDGDTLYCIKLYPSLILTLGHTVLQGEEGCTDPRWLFFLSSLEPLRFLAVAISGDLELPETSEPRNREFISIRLVVVI